jgi:hypothetical protein
MQTTNYKFEIIRKSWAKRRKSAIEPLAVSVTIPDFKLEEQHFCNMLVSYDDGSQQTFFARVLRNHITNQWTVDGMHVAVRVLF